MKGAVKLMEPSELLLLIAGLADDKKARDARAFDMRGRSSLSDYSYICTVDAGRQGLAVCDHIQTELKQRAALLPLGVEGRETAEWILMDYGDVLVHIMTEVQREYYRLEHLWDEAPEVDLEIPDSGAR